MDATGAPPRQQPVALPAFMVGHQPAGVPLQHHLHHPALARNIPPAGARHPPLVHPTAERAHHHNHIHQNNSNLSSSTSTTQPQQPPQEHLFPTQTSAPSSRYPVVNCVTILNMLTNSLVAHQNLNQMHLIQQQLQHQQQQQPPFTRSLPVGHPQQDPRNTIVPPLLQPPPPPPPQQPQQASQARPVPMPSQNVTVPQATEQVSCQQHIQLNSNNNTATAQQRLSNQNAPPTGGYPAPMSNINFNLYHQQASASAGHHAAMSQAPTMNQAPPQSNFQPQMQLPPLDLLALYSPLTILAQAEIVAALSHIFHIDNPIGQFIRNSLRPQPHHQYQAPHYQHHFNNSHHHHHGPNSQQNGQDAAMPLDSLAISESKPRGLNRAEIDSLTPHIQMNDKDPRTCVICLSRFELKSKIRPLPCHHAFHAKCVDKWLKANRTCPICRRDALKPHGAKIKRI